MVNVSFFPAENRVYVESDNHDSSLAIGRCKKQKSLFAILTQICLKIVALNTDCSGLWMFRVEQMLQVTVSLTSGRSASLSIPLASTVGDLKTKVQESLGKLFLRLITADGRELKPSEFLEAAGLQDGDQLTDMGPSRPGR